MRLKVLLTALGLVLAVFVAYVDYVTGYRVSFSIFYLIPISLVVWYVSRAAGLAVAGLCAIMWLLEDLVTGVALPTTFVPYWQAGMRLGFFVIIVVLLDGRKRAEGDRERLIGELQDALGKMRTLRGLLPICMSCKKIRDDKGYWNQIEGYVSAHSEADFSHSICPECEKKLYPELAE